MQRFEADNMLAEQLRELKTRAEKADKNEDFIALNDALLKVYLMMSNAGSFDGTVPDGMFPNGPAGTAN